MRQHERTRLLKNKSVALRWLGTAAGETAITRERDGNSLATRSVSFERRSVA